MENQTLSGLNVDKLCEAEGLFNTEVGKRLKAADKYGGERSQPAQASQLCSSLSVALQQVSSQGSMGQKD